MMTSHPLLGRWPLARRAQINPAADASSVSSRQHLLMSQAEAALQISAISRSYGERKAVDDLSFSVQRGEVVGFLGPNGAGKTTTIRMCLHLIRPSAGSVLIGGRNVWRDGPGA